MKNDIKSGLSATQPNQAAINPLYDTTQPLLSFSIQRMPVVMARTGHAKSTIYKLISEGKFPKQVSLGSRAVGWRSSSIDSYIASLTEKGA